MPKGSDTSSAGYPLTLDQLYPVERADGDLSKDSDYMKISRKRQQERKAAAKKHQEWLDEQRYKF